MKKVVLLIALLVTFLSINAQNFYKIEKTDEFGKSEVVEEQLTKDNLFVNAKSWISSTYKDYKAVVQFEDKEAGKISLKAISEAYDVSNLNGTRFRYTITIECKEGRYRYTINDIVFQSHWKGKWSDAPSTFLPLQYSRIDKGEKEHLEWSLNCAKFFNNTIDSIVTSLKKRMSINDDF